MSDGRLPTEFVGSDGNRYTASTVCQRLADDRWRSCILDLDTDRELVEDEHGDLVLLVPADEIEPLARCGGPHSDPAP